MTYWTFDWRKEGGSQRMIEIAKQEQFYQQEYCGCVYSLRYSNRWRLQNGRSRIEIGVKFYGKEKTVSEQVSNIPLANEVISGYFNGGRTILIRG